MYKIYPYKHTPKIWLQLKVLIPDEKKGGLKKIRRNKGKKKLKQKGERS